MRTLFIFNFTQHRQPTYNIKLKNLIVNSNNVQIIIVQLKELVLETNVTNTIIIINKYSIFCLDTTCKHSKYTT
jgi:hypothetical protein